MSDQTENTVLVKCRRGNDKATSGQSCDSLTAIRLSQPGSSTAMFQCVKCRHTWAVSIGGSFDL